MDNGLRAKLDALTHDAVMFFSAEALKDAGAMSPKELQTAISDVGRWIAMIPGEVMRDAYTERIYAAHRKHIGKRKHLTEAAKTQEATVVALKPSGTVAADYDDEMHLPDGIDPADVYRDGFYQIVDGKNTGVHFRMSNKYFAHICNFTIEPLFHKRDMDDNTRVMRVTDGITTRVVEMPTETLLKRDAFRAFMFTLGPYFFEGNQAQLDKINLALMYRFPIAYEIKQLGAQAEGFFAYYNYAFNGALKPYDSAGLVKHGNEYFYSPAASDAYSDDRENDGLFENDKYLEYIPPPITFDEWMKLVFEAYPEQFQAIIGGVFLALHRDVHFRIDGNCPFIYFYGPSQSGKSKAAYTLSNVFFNNLPAFALSTGTEPAFAQRLGRYRNTPALLNEFDEWRIAPDRFNAIKNSYDGEGRERTKGNYAKRKTETQKVTTLVVLIGQYLITSDDNSVPSRSILCRLRLMDNHERTEEQVAAYLRLKKLEEEGLTGVLTELMVHREEVDKRYYEVFHRIKREIGDKFRKNNELMNERVLHNYCSIPAFWEIFAPYFKLPVSVDDIKAWATEEIAALSSQVRDTDVLRDFWTALMSLADQRIIRQGEHFKRESVKSVELTTTVNGVRRTETQILPEPRWVMWIQMDAVHREYQKLSRSATGKPGIDRTTIVNYMRDRDYFIGWTHSTRFMVKESNIEGGSKSYSRTRSAFLIDIEKAELSGLFTDVDYTLADEGDDTKTHDSGDELKF